MPRARSTGTNGSGKSVALSSLAGKWGGSPTAAPVGNASWSDVDPHLVFTLVHVVTQRRGAVMLGVDRQGVGLTLCVWLGGEKVLNKWYNPLKGGIEDLHGHIEEFLADLATIPDEL